MFDKRNREADFLMKAAAGACVPQGQMASIMVQSSLSSCAQTMEPKRPEVTVFVEQIYARTDCLSERIAVLEQRLGPVLRDRVPAGEAGKADAVATSELGAALASLSTRLSLLIEAVSSIESRLEL